MANIRIKDQPLDTALSPGDLIIVDSEESGVGTRKFDLGTELTDIKEDLAELQGGGVPTNVRQALKTLLESAAYADTGLTDEMAVVSSWASAVTAITLNHSSINISGTTTSQLTATTTPSGGTVTWSSSDTSVATVSSSGLVTGVSNGTATITATSGSVSATCSVAVIQTTLVSISAVYTQSGTVYDTDTLDSLKTDLVVTATWSDSSTSTVASNDYTLSGTLSAGTSTITVSFEGQTDTFTVTVTSSVAILDIATGLVPNVYLTTSGAESSYSGWNATDFIDVSSYSEIQIYTDDGLTGTFKQNYCHWYNSEKTRTATLAFGVQGGALSAGGTTGWISIPSGSKYFRLSDVSANLPDHIFVKAQ